MVTRRLYSMTKRIGFSFLLVASLFCLLTFANSTQAQQTLGGITGAVTDASGAALPDTTVTLVGSQTPLTRTKKSDATGVYTFVNLPIGSYTLTFTHASFETQKIPSITVQANRTLTVNAALSVGAVSTTVTVEETPLINAVDTTNGYVLDKVQMESVPLPTGSFTGLAILSPGINAELPSGTGVNAGLGNQAIWANGQRDTSTTFLLNGVDASNRFNGKSTSTVASARVVNNTGIGGAASISSTTAEPIQTTASPYLAIGQALPSPPPETIQEFRTNTSMYGAEQGSTSGAQIDMSTPSAPTKFTAARTFTGVRTGSTRIRISTSSTGTSRKRTRIRGCIARVLALHGDSRSSRTSFSCLFPISTYTIPIRRLEARACPSRLI